MLQHQPKPVKLQIGGMFTGEKTCATIKQAIKKSGLLSQRTISSNVQKRVDLEKIVNEADRLINGKELVFHEGGAMTQKGITTNVLGQKVKGLIPVYFNYGFFTIEATNSHHMTEEDKHFMAHMAKEASKQKIAERKN